MEPKTLTGGMTDSFYRTVGRDLRIRKTFWGSVWSLRGLEMTNDWLGAVAHACNPSISGG